VLKKYKHAIAKIIGRFDPTINPYAVIKMIKNIGDKNMGRNLCK